MRNLSLYLFFLSSLTCPCSALPLAGQNHDREDLERRAHTYSVVPVDGGSGASASSALAAQEIVVKTVQTTDLITLPQATQTIISTLDIVSDHTRTVTVTEVSTQPVETSYLVVDPFPTEASPNLTTEQKSTFTTSSKPSPSPASATQKFSAKAPCSTTTTSTSTTPCSTSAITTSKSSTSSSYPASTATISWLSSSDPSISQPPVNSSSSSQVTLQPIIGTSNPAPPVPVTSPTTTTALTSAVGFSTLLSTTTTMQTLVSSIPPISRYSSTSTSSSTHDDGMWHTSYPPWNWNSTMTSTTTAPLGTGSLA